MPYKKPISTDLLTRLYARGWTLREIAVEAERAEGITISYMGIKRKLIKLGIYQPRRSIRQDSRLVADPQEPDAGFVYVFRSGTRYKIGKAVNPQHRLSGLRHDYPDIALIHKIKTNYKSVLESVLHYVFRACRDTGEWFFLSDDQLGQIQCVKRVSSLEEIGALFGIDAAKFTPERPLHKAVGRSMKPIRCCSVEGCQERAWANNPYCPKHTLRERRYGDPSIVLKPRKE